MSWMLVHLVFILEPIRSSPAEVSQWLQGEDEGCDAPRGRGVAVTHVTRHDNINPSLVTLRDTPATHLRHCIPLAAQPAKYSRLFIIHQNSG